jgi:hypothetical protein
MPVSIAQNVLMVSDVQALIRDRKSAKTCLTLLDFPGKKQLPSLKKQPFQTFKPFNRLPTTTPIPMVPDVPPLRSVPTVKLTKGPFNGSKTDKLWALPRFGNSRNVEIKIWPEMGDYPLRDDNWLLSSRLKNAELLTRIY